MSAATILLIARRELSAYFRTWNGYVIIALALFLVGLAFNGLGLNDTAKRSADVLSIFFYISSGLLGIAAPVLISMRLLAEERQLGTMTLLYSSPVRDSEVVLGKYVSALVFLIVLLATTLFMPLLVLVHGKIALGQILGGYLGVLLLGSASLAVGIFGSALVASPVIAVVISTVMLSALVLCWNLARVTERPVSEVVTGLALWNQHFPPFQTGVIHLRDVIYYLALTYFFLFIAVRVLEARRWR